MHVIQWTTNTLLSILTLINVYFSDRISFRVFAFMLWNVSRWKIMNKKTMLLYWTLCFSHFRYHFVSQYVIAPRFMVWKSIFIQYSATDYRYPEFSAWNSILVNVNAALWVFKTKAYLLWLVEPKVNNLIENLAHTNEQKCFFRTLVIVKINILT